MFLGCLSSLQQSPNLVTHAAHAIQRPSQSTEGEGHVYPVSLSRNMEISGDSCAQLCMHVASYTRHKQHILTSRCHSRSTAY